MTIIFFQNEKLYICAEGETMKIVSRDDPNILNLIPDNDDVIYVQNAHLIRKDQFGEWLRGEVDFYTPYQDMQELNTGSRARPSGTEQSYFQQYEQNQYTNTPDPNRLFIHPVHNGTVRIEDIKTQRFPYGVELNGKWDFLPLEEIGEDAVDESIHLRTLLAKGKIEIVREDFVRKNQHKKRQMSSADAALDAILVHDDKQGAAMAVASAGGVQYYRNPRQGQPSQSTNDGAIPIYVD